MTKITGAGFSRAHGHVNPGPGSCGTFGNKGEDCEYATPRHNGCFSSWLWLKPTGTSGKWMDKEDRRQGRMLRCPPLVLLGPPVNQDAGPGDPNKWPSPPLNV